MWGVRVGVLVVGLGVLSGCASGHTRQDLARLQSQVGLLDERVSQLERTGASSASTSSWNESTAPTESAATSAATSSAGAAPTHHAAAHVSHHASKKPATREIQQALKNAGFYQGAVDGKMGPQTKDAVKEFQRVQGLKDDGTVGKQTWAKLSAYLEGAPAKDGTTEVSLK